MDAEGRNRRNEGVQIATLLRDSGMVDSFNVNGRHRPRHDPDDPGRRHAIRFDPDVASQLFRMDDAVAARNNRVAICDTPRLLKDL